MRWQDIQSAVRSAVELASGGVSAAWDRRASGWRADEFVKLDVLNVERVGGSEIVRHYLEDEDKITQIERGARVLVVQVMAESQSQELHKTGLAIAEKIRSRLSLLEVRALIEASGIAVATAGPILNASYVEPGDSGRHISRGAFEIRFNAMTVEAGDLLDTIERVEAEGKVYSEGADMDADGAVPRLAESWEFLLDDATD